MCLIRFKLRFYIRRTNRTFSTHNNNNNCAFARRAMPVDTICCCCPTAFWNSRYFVYTFLVSLKCSVLRLTQNKKIPGLTVCTIVETERRVGGRRVVKFCEPIYLLIYFLFFRRSVKVNRNTLRTYGLWLSNNNRYIL